MFGVNGDQKPAPTEKSARDLGGAHPDGFIKDDKIGGESGGVRKLARV
jgi:hypothetical protein